MEYGGGDINLPGAGLPGINMTQASASGVAFAGGRGEPQGKDRHGTTTPRPVRRRRPAMRLRFVLLTPILLAGLAGCTDGSPDPDAPVNATSSPVPTQGPPTDEGSINAASERQNTTQWHVWGVQHPLRWQQVSILNDNCLAIYEHREANLVELGGTLDRGGGVGLVSNWRFGFFILGSDNDWWFETTGTLPLSNTVNLQEYPIGDWEDADRILVYAIPDDLMSPAAADEQLTMELSMVAQEPDLLVLEDRHACA